MAGLLPSEGKLRGSPANILGRCAARQNLSRVFLFRHGAHRDFCARNFLPDRGGNTRTHTRIARTEQSNRDARKTQNSCGFAQYDAIGTQKIAQLIVTRRRSHARCKNLLSRDASNIDATNRATWIAGKILSCIDHAPIVQRRPCDGGHRSQSHRRIDVQQSVHRSCARASARRNRISGSSRPENRSSDPQPLLDPRIRDSRGNGWVCVASTPRARPYASVMLAFAKTRCIDATPSPAQATLIATDDRCATQSTIAWRR